MSLENKEILVKSQNYMGTQPSIQSPSVEINSLLALMLKKYRKIDIKVFRIFNFLDFLIFYKLFCRGLLKHLVKISEDLVKSCSLSSSIRSSQEYWDVSSIRKDA